MLTRNVLSSRYLNGFEEYCTSTAITFRMDLPLKQGPKGEVKSEGEAGGTAAASSSSEEQKPQVDGEPCGAQSVVCKVLSLTSFFLMLDIYPNISSFSRPPVFVIMKASFSHRTRIPM